MPALKRAKILPIVKYLSRKDRLPATVEEADLTDWIEKEVRGG